MPGIFTLASPGAVTDLGGVRNRVASSYAKSARQDLLYRDSCNRCAALVAVLRGCLWLAASAARRRSYRVRRCERRRKRHLDRGAAALDYSWAVDLHLVR